MHTKKQSKRNLICLLIGMMIVCAMTIVLILQRSGNQGVAGVKQVLAPSVVTEIGK